MNLGTAQEPLTMSSREIADLLECRHDNVKVDHKNSAMMTANQSQPPRLPQHDQPPHCT